MPLSLIGRTPTAAADLARDDVPWSPEPAAEGPTLVEGPTLRNSFGTGPEEPPESMYETRRPTLRRMDYSHDQSGGQTWTNDGGRVQVSRNDPTQPGDQETTGSPQRPTFRTAPGVWTDPLIDRGD